MRSLKVLENFAVFGWAVVAVVLSGCPKANTGAVSVVRKRAAQTGPKVLDDEVKGKAKTAVESPKAPEKAPKAAPEEEPKPGGKQAEATVEGKTSEKVDPTPDEETMAAADPEPPATEEDDSGDDPGELQLLPNPLLEKEIAKAEATKDQIPVVEEPKIPELGLPLVEDPARLERLLPGKPAWWDPETMTVVMIGRVCQTETRLEMFACLVDTKEHEAVVAVDTQAYAIHAALLRIGANDGEPAKWDPEYVPASGSEIDITLHWKDKEGKIQTAKAQDWIRNLKTNKAMTFPFVFAGSGHWVDEQTGERHYQAEGGDFICVSNFPTAMLDLPIKSSQTTEELMFEAFTQHIPPRGTPVTLVLSVAKTEEPTAAKEDNQKEDQRSEKEKKEADEKEQEEAKPGEK